ncbi:replication terminator protein [Alicyclobacillus sp. ALC3]|uniref:replication terminator protein n=1 Tax=Alicyclobacillus sp. ALC3 TaxID=2796143 RepID=UPI00237964C9|nr:replication terminator protein [Alicyclobacillus sp. ALC3]WDL98153.1 replication terminator protein [Alicyclobacillus sp. ALC3]
MNLAELAGGAVSERFEIELQKVLDNIMDPNTDPTKARAITLQLKFKTDEYRDVAGVDISVKSVLAPAEIPSTKILLDRDGAGKVVGAELIQQKLFDEREVDQANHKVSYLESKQGRV